jgi:hypothetical protein
MYQQLFGSPVWVTKIEPQKLFLNSKNFKKHWSSQTLSSFSDNPEDNVFNENGESYLLNKISNCLIDVNVKKIKLIQIWRNIYQNTFQDRHMHVKSHFSFSIYEKIQKPQTVFYHPAYDMIYALGLENYIQPTIQPNVVQGDMVVFPSYLQHMVKNSDQTMTISGNIEIIE